MTNDLDTELATSSLREIVHLNPDNASAWRDLGDALAAEGNLEEAEVAFRQAAHLRPDDTQALSDLAHITYTRGRHEEGIELLSRAAERDPGNIATLRSLVEMYRHAGRLQDALDVAVAIARHRPEDVLATMDIAELSQAAGDLDSATSAYARLRQIDTEPEHEVYVLHSMIQVEMQRERWRRALDLAIDATRVDRYGLTTDLLAFVVAQIFGPSDRPVPPRSDIEADLAKEQAAHRRFHVEALTLS